MARRLQIFLSVLLMGFASFARLRERNDVRSSAIDARRDDRHPDGVAKSVVKGRAHDDVGLVVDLLTDPAGGLIESSVRSRLPVMETSRPRAPRIEVSSSSGLAIAASAA